MNLAGLLELAVLMHGFIIELSRLKNLITEPDECHGDEIPLSSHGTLLLSSYNNHVISAKFNAHETMKLH
jgi:hypothetical protein